MPGVVVTTGVRTGPTGVVVAPSSTWFVAGTAQRGPTNAAKLVTSLSDFETFYGTYDSAFTLHQQVKTYFEEGGARAYVARAAGASVTAGTLVLQATGPTPGLTIIAANAGAWSSGISVAVVAGVASGFAVQIYYGGVLVYATGDCANITTAVNKINSSTVATIYVNAVAIVPSAVLIVAAATSVSAGAPGIAPTAAALVTSLELFNISLGSGAVSIVDQFGTTIYNGLLAHGVARSRIAILGFDPSATSAAAITTAGTYATAVGSEGASFYFPHVQVPGPSSTTLTISPEGYVAAKRSIAHNSYGSWQPGAGLISQAAYLTGVASSVDKTVGDLLDAGRVNAIRIIQGTIRIYGARAVSSDEDNYRYITYRDTLNYIVVEAERLLEDLVFSTIDGRRTIFGRVEARLIGLLDPIRTSNGLYAAFDADGTQIDPGYSVEVSDALNPVSQLATGLVKAKCGVRVSAVGDRLEIQVVKSNLTSSVV